MKNWNATGKIKAIVLAVIFMGGFFIHSVALPISLVLIIIPLILGSVALPLIIKVMSFELSKPNWNDNPFRLRRPLIMSQFFAYWFLADGTSILIKTAIREHQIDGIALSGIAFGVGILIGINLAIRWGKKK